MEKSKDELKGLGGWLVLFGFGLLISPIRNIAIAILSWSDIYEIGAWSSVTDVSSVSYIPFFGSLLIFELVFSTVVFTLSIYIIYLFFRERSSFPKAYILISIVSIAFIVIDAILVSVVLSADTVFDSQTSRELTTLLISSAIWIPYLLNSIRVRNTFVNEGNAYNEFKIIGVVSVLSAACLITPLVLDEPILQVNNQTEILDQQSGNHISTVLSELIKESNELNLTLPKMMDSNTRLDSTMVYDGRFIYKYSFVNSHTEEIDVPYFVETATPVITNRVCKSDNLRGILEKGVPLEYAYYDKNGAKVASMTIEFNQCT